MNIKNQSTGKIYPVTQEVFDSNFKGKENWIVIDEKEPVKNQMISNIKIEKPDLAPVKIQGENKKRNQNTKK